MPKTTDLDIYRSAKLLIDQHGQNAARHAAKRANALLEPGDMKGCRVVAQHSGGNRGVAANEAQARLFFNLANMLIAKH